MLKTKPDLSFAKLFNISFGFFGVQIAYALQSANISRIFATLGADPHDLSYFWILPPLMGMLVQPLVGYYSDKTWCRFGRRIPYLFVGAIVAVLVMCVLPNAGSFGLAVSGAMVFGLIALMFLDTSINMAMQPFKMMVGDLVNEKQKTKAYSIQSFLCNAGSVVGFLFPFIFTYIGIKNEAEQGVVPDSVVYSFYVGAAILVLCVIYTVSKVKEMPPAEYAMYSQKQESNEEKVGMFKLLKNAPKTFWTVGLVQFFCWFAFMYMWTYSTGTVAIGVYEAPAATKITSLSKGNDQIVSKYIQIGDSIVVNKSILLNKENEHLLTTPGVKLLVSNLADSVVVDEKTGKKEFKLTKPNQVIVEKGTKVSTTVSIDTTSKPYNKAGNTVGILMAIQALGSVLWACVIPYFRRKKTIYILSLVLGGIGFVSTYFFHNIYALWFSYALIGCAWAAMLALPFTILTNSLEGHGHMGTYLGLFNGTICLPQIVAALLGGTILGWFSTEGQIAPEGMMLVVAGIALFVGAASVLLIKEKE